MTTDVGTALIRPARPADGAAIKRVHVETWRDTYAGILPTSYLVHRVGSGFRPTSGRPGSESSESTYVAEVGEVVGFVSFGHARHVRDRRMGEIYALYILPEFHGLGLGRNLVCVALDQLFSRGKSAVDVEVVSANPSRFFYAATGARMIGTGVHRFAGQELGVTFYRWQRNQESTKP